MDYCLVEQVAVSPDQGRRHGLRRRHHINLDIFPAGKLPRCIRRHCTQIGRVQYLVRQRLGLGRRHASEQLVQFQCAVREASDLRVYGSGRMTVRIERMQFKQRQNRR